MKAPDAAERQRIAALGPQTFQFAESIGRLGSIPIVCDVKQIAARLTIDLDLIQGVLTPARRGNTALPCNVDFGGDANG